MGRFPRSGPFCLYGSVEQFFYFRAVFEFENQGFVSGDFDLFNHIYKHLVGIYQRHILHGFYLFYENVDFIRLGNLLLNGMLPAFKNPFLCNR